MENILHDFNEKVINLVTNYLKNSISDGGLSNFTDDLVKEFADLGTKTENFLVNYAEETIFKLKERKEQFGVRIDIWTHFMRECIINYVH